MKITRKKPTYAQQMFSFFLAFGLIMLMFAPVGAVEAQTGAPSAPLFDELSWTDLGPGERAFRLNDEFVTLSGTSYQADQPFDMEGPEGVAAHYSTTNLAGFGWQEISTTSQPNGVTSVYFHPAGVYAVVEFVACEADATLACLTVWQSAPTDIVPAQDDVVQPQAVGTVSKSSPANGATNVDTTVTLSWNAYTGTDLNRYRYCIDKTNNSDCDSSGGWSAVWSGRSVTLTGLESNVTYYWQVEAVHNDESKVAADGGTWWSFTTRTVTAPGIFTKTLPANGTTGQSITPTLVWQASANTSTYEYCIDTTNNNICDSNWVSNSTTSVTLLTGLGPNITYYWQVRAVNTGGIVYADTSNWASFTTAPGPANDTIDSAFNLTVPYENIESTTAATLDTGTTNACSPALGLSSVWYKYSATANRKIYVDTFGSSYDTFIAVWIRSTSGIISLVVCNDNAAGVVQSNIDLSVLNGTTYYIQVAQKNSGSATVATPGGTLNFRVRNFADVAGNNIFWKNIEGLYAAGITGGCATSPDLLYCPAQNVTRAQMAIFLLKGIHGAAYLPPAVGTTTGFTDVPVTYWAAAWVKQLAAEGITTGCGAGIFCPEGFVTRDQMAVFLLRSKHGTGYVPPSSGGSTGFADVPPTYWAADWIKQLAAEGITTGCGGGNFCPGGTVTRDQMSAFLSRTFNVPPRP